MSEPLRLRIAFQGGGAKIAALLAAGEHIQQMHAKKKIQVTRVAGTSAGAIVGALLAAGVPIDRVRERIREISDKEWQKMFGIPRQYRLFWRLFKNQPVLDWRELDRFLRSFFKEVKTFEDATQRTGIKLFVTSANITHSKLVVYPRAPDDDLVESLIDSAALPFVYRTCEQGGNPVIVDGGICETLPAELLSPQDRDENEQIIGVSFERDPVADVRSTFTFAKGLLYTAMQHSVDRACRQIGEDAILRLSTSLTTFDFDKLRTVGLGQEYDLIKDRTKDWFVPLLESWKKTKGILVGDPWHGRDREAMAALSRIYTHQHADRPISYASYTLEVKAYCLLSEQDPRHDIPDEIVETFVFSPDRDPIDCILYSLSSTTGTGFFPTCSYNVTDPQGQRRRCELLPALDETDEDREARLRREFLLFFLPPITHAETGPFTARYGDQVFHAMEGLRTKGSDFVRVKWTRSPAAPFPVHLVLHVPESFPDLEMKGLENSVPGSPLPAGSLRHPSPVGFRAVGWSGQISMRGEIVGVEFQRKS